MAVSSAADRSGASGACRACGIRLGKGERTASELLRLLDVREVSGTFDRFEAGARDGRTIGAPVFVAQDAVGGAPEHQRRNSDAVQPALELGAVHVGRPAEPRIGFAV